MLFIDKLTEITGKLFSWIVLLLAIVVVYEVIARYFFNNPSVCSFEYTQQLFGFYFILLGGYALLKDEHVRIDIFQSKFSKRWKKIVDFICFVLLFFPFVIAMFFNTLKFGLVSWKQGERVWSVCSSPLYPVKMVMPFAFFLLFLQGISTFYKKMVRIQ